MAKTWAAENWWDSIQKQKFLFYFSISSESGQFTCTKNMHMLVDTYNRVKIRTNEGEIPFIWCVKNMGARSSEEMMLYSSFIK